MDLPPKKKSFKIRFLRHSSYERPGGEQQAIGGALQFNRHSVRIDALYHAEPDQGVRLGVHDQ